MSNDFMQNWFTVWLAITIALAPFTTFYGIVKAIFKDETPPGCLVLGAFLLLLAGAPLGWWFFIHFAVVWRP